MNTMTPSELSERGQYWQDVLGLNDWEIRFAYAEPHELGSAWADNQFDQYHKTALIRILAPRYAALQQWPTPEYDVDFSLIHELIHLAVEPMGVNDPTDDTQLCALEQFVNKFTGIIAALEAQGTTE